MSSLFSQSANGIYPVSKINKITPAENISTL